MRNVRCLPSPALVVALVALFVALSGAATAGTVLATHSTQAPSARPEQTAVTRSLARRVAILEKKVNALQKGDKEIKNVILAVAFYSICNTAITADALQGTWQTIDQLSAATQSGKIYFGPQVPVDDSIAGHHICQAIGVTRSNTVPPNVSTFNALLALFRQ